MKDVVSRYGIPVGSLFASLSIAWFVYAPYSLPWAGFAFSVLAAGLAGTAALLVSRNSTRSISQVIESVEAEPHRAPVRVANPAPRAIL
jgi:hypothetical protein